MRRTLIDPERLFEDSTSPAESKASTRRSGDMSYDGWRAEIRES